MFWREIISEKQPKTYSQCLRKCYVQQNWSLSYKTDCFRNRKAELHDLPCSGCPVTAVNLEMLQRDDAVLREPWRNTNRQLDPSLSFSKGSVILDMRTCVRDGFAEGSQSNTKPRGKMFFRVFSNFLKLRKRPYPELLQHMKSEPIIFEVETKGLAMKWHHPQCSKKGKFKASFSRQDHDHCLVDCEGLILVDVVNRGERINSDAYVRTLTKIRKRFKRDRPTRIQQISCFRVTM